MHDGQRPAAMEDGHCLPSLQGTDDLRCFSIEFGESDSHGRSWVTADMLESIASPKRQYNPAMKSPFPGMDPYLELRWSDVHVTLIGFTKEALQRRLPPGLRARADEHLLQETYVRVVQIIDTTSGNRVVSVIEILSPWNKEAGRLNQDYLRKLDDYARGQVNVVEIDLLRRPSRVRLPVSQADPPASRRAPYLVCVRRAASAHSWEVYPMPLHEPLPCVPVPLRPGDEDVGLELQPLIDRVYAAGGHDDIDYSRPPEPPLDAEDAAWVAKLLPPDRT